MKGDEENTTCLSQPHRLYHLHPFNNTPHFFPPSHPYSFPPSTTPQTIRSSSPIPIHPQSITSKHTHSTNISFTTPSPSLLFLQLLLHAPTQLPQPSTLCPHYPIPLTSTSTSSNLLPSLQPSHSLLPLLSTTTTTLTIFCTLHLLFNSKNTFLLRNKYSEYTPAPTVTMSLAYYCLIIIKVSSQNTTSTAHSHTLYTLTESRTRFPAPFLRLIPFHYNHTLHHHTVHSLVSKQTLHTHSNPSLPNTLLHNNQGNCLRSLRIQPLCMRIHPS